MKAVLVWLPGLVLATLILHLVLIQPNHPRAMTWEALLLFPLELPFIVLLLVAVPATGRVSRGVRAVLVGFLVVVATLKSADFAMVLAFNRTFNPLVDLHLVEAGLRLASGTIGLVPTILAATGAAVLPVLVALALWWATGRWVAVAPPMRIRWTTGIAAALALVVVVAEIGQVRRAWALPVAMPGTAFTARVALERTIAYRGLVAELAQFHAAAAADPMATHPDLFDRLAGHDVLIVFVESYGRTSFDNPLYAPTHIPTLERAQARLEAEGLALRSGWLTSPISGGQSWLAHGTLASGLATGNQARYAAMLASPRRTLFHLAAESGYRTAAVMPAITLPWPEARLLGFEEVYDAGDLGYRGQPFNWVTMPDQYTLAAYERLFEEREEPVFVQMALISSHAPWVPIPEMVDWDAVGDGTIFDRWATSGDPPSVVWRDRDRVRDQYRMAIDYALEAVMAFAARGAGRDRLLLVLGDHPPAAFVSQIESLDVPMHVIGPPELVARIESWNWTPGLIPDADAPVWPMEAFRDRLIGAFTSGL